MNKEYKCITFVYDESKNTYAPCNREATKITFCQDEGFKPWIGRFCDLHYDKYKNK